ncbi:unnamed protein product [Ixodes hexagonus]
MIVSTCCSAATADNVQDPSPFDSVISQRRQESASSLLIEVENRHKIIELCQVCLQYGELTKAYYYTGKQQKCQVLLEFDSSESAQKLLKECKHLSSDGFPVWSRLLKFAPKDSSRQPVTSIPVDIETCSVSSTSQLSVELMRLTTVSEQMVCFYENERLNDLELRLGFLVCKQIEEFISGFYPRGSVLPFGSLVNGFGRHNCDIDMVYCVPESVDSRGQLYFQDKHQMINDRTLVQRILETLGDLLHYLVPGVSEVHRILRARVPIVKFQHDIVDRECDLTLNNMSGVDMSRVLHFCSQLAPSLGPLVFTLRGWASAQGLTNKVPGTWITNFQLTLLVIFHLQRKGLLPPLKALEGKKGWSERNLGTNALVKHKEALKNNAESFEELLVTFFEYYLSVDFKSKSISPYAGQLLEKPDYSAIHIQNPLDRQLNASRNIGAPDLRKLQSHMGSALVALEEASRRITQEAPWGIMALLSNCKQPHGNRKIEQAHRKFQVQELFQEGKGGPKTSYVVEATAKGVKGVS